MGLFTIDRQTCDKDGICSRECPLVFYTMKSDDGFPAPVEGAEQACISCGHCVAVCPQGALSLAGMPKDQCPALPEGWQLSLPQVKTLLQSRRSIRSFTEEPVSREDIEALVDAARYAPSGINRQPVSWSVVTGREKVRAAAQLVIEWMRELIAQGSPLAQSLRMEAMITSWSNGNDRICRGASNLVIAYALKDDLTAPAAATIALTYFELAAVSHGLGACWAGYVAMAVNHYPPLKELIGLRKRHSCYGAIMLGYPRYRYYRVPARNAARIIWR